MVTDPETEWTANDPLRSQIAEWTRQRGKSPHLYPGSLVWCLKKPSRGLREKGELWLAWKRVAEGVDGGTLRGDFDRKDVRSKVGAAKDNTKDEVWGRYQVVAIAASPKEADELTFIDLGVGHFSSDETLCGRVIAALRSGGVLSESFRASSIERNWPPALKGS